MFGWVCVLVLCVCAVCVCFGRFGCLGFLVFCCGLREFMLFGSCVLVCFVCLCCACFWFYVHGYVRVCFSGIMCWVCACDCSCVFVFGVGFVIFVFWFMLRFVFVCVWFLWLCLCDVFVVLGSVCVCGFVFPWFVHCVLFLCSVGFFPCV